MSFCFAGSSGGEGVVEDRIIAETNIGRFFISTEVHNGEYNSVLIELNDPNGFFKKKYISEEEAIEGHQSWCNYIRSKHGVNP